MNTFVRQLPKQIFIQGLRTFAISQNLGYKVTVCGAAGGIGQPLSLLLKNNPLVCELKVHDVVNTPGVACDLSHIDTFCPVAGYKGPEGLVCALFEADVVVIPAGVPRKPGMTRDDLFNMNAGIVKDLTRAICDICPNAIIAIITNPVNSTVPIAAETLKKYKAYNPRHLFGVTTLDVVRAKTFLGNAMNVDPAEVCIPVIGGHSGITIIPLISNCVPKYGGCDTSIKALTERIQDAGTEVVEAKGGAGSATLSMAYAAARFTTSILRGLKGEQNLEYAYVESDVTEAKFFASPIILGKRGLEQNLGVPPLTEYEEGLVTAAIPELKANIEKGVQFVRCPPKIKLEDKK